MSRRAAGATCLATLLTLALWVAAGVMLGVRVGADATEPGTPAQLTYRLRYEAQLLPGQGTASVRLRVTQDASVLRELSFRFDSERHFEFEAAEGLAIEDDRVTWTIPEDGGELRYRVRIDHLRDPARYDARCTPRWALFRGEDLFPSFASRRATGARGRFSFRLRVPPDWEIVAPYRVGRSGAFVISDQRRGIDQPKGWILAGELRVLREDVSGMSVAIANPDRDAFRGRDLIALLRWVAPELEGIFGSLPKRLTIVGADDPMWRGGLSGPNSIYLHSDLPLIDPAWTSPLLHELIHVLTRARSVGDGDWIVEGLAEYYSLELLRRSGTIGDESFQEAMAKLERRGRAVRSLVGGDASGDVTARAVTIFHALDQRLRDESDGVRSLDDVLRALQRDPDAVEPQRFRLLIAEVAGRDPSEFAADPALGLAFAVLPSPDVAAAPQKKRPEGTP